MADEAPGVPLGTGMEPVGDQEAERRHWANVEPRPGDRYEFAEAASGAGQVMHVRVVGRRRPVCGALGRLEAYCTGLPLCGRCGYWLERWDIPVDEVAQA